MPQNAFLKTGNISRSVKSRCKLYAKPTPEFAARSICRPAPSPTISEISGEPVYLKLENLQRTGSFKERGALNKILTLTQGKEAGRDRGQRRKPRSGRGLSREENGISAKIVMPVMTPLVKVNATKGYGAHVVLHGDGYDEAYEEACRLAEAEQLTFVHPFDDPRGDRGARNIGLEIARAGSRRRGDRGAHRRRRPDQRHCLRYKGIASAACAVIGVQPARMPSMLEALKVHQPTTIASIPPLPTALPSAALAN